MDPKADRAKHRRKQVGSSCEYEKTEIASLETYVGISTFLGPKLRYSNNTFFSSRSFSIEILKIRCFRENKFPKSLEYG